MQTLATPRTGHRHSSSAICGVCLPARNTLCHVLPSLAIFSPPMKPFVRHCLLAGALLAVAATCAATPARQHRAQRHSKETSRAAPPATQQAWLATEQEDAARDRVAGVEASLQAVLLLSTQYAVQDMYFFSPPQFPPRLQTADTLYVGQSALLVPIVRRYAVSEAGEMDVRYKPTSVLPDGTIEDDLGEVSLYTGKAPEGGALLFPTRGLDAFYAGEDQGLGTFILRAQITDYTSGESLTLEQPVTVIAYEVPVLPEDFDANNWMLHYYAAPSPELALPALFALMANADADQLNRTTAPLLGFYDRILADNSWLLPHFSSRLEDSLNKVSEGTAPTAADIMLGLVLSFHLREATERPEQISERIWMETESNRLYDWASIDPGSSNYIHYPQQLDYLWGQFFASGAYPPVRRLLGILFQDEAAAAAAAPQALQKLSQEQRDTLQQAVLAAARWSLMNNAIRHRLTLAYLFGIFFNEHSGLSPEEREELHRLLSATLQAQRSENTLETVGEKESAPAATPDTAPLDTAPPDKAAPPSTASPEAPAESIQ